MLRDHWYPLLRTRDLPLDRPVAAHLLGEPLVLFRDAAGTPHCLADRCSHRSVPLSLGRICDGKLECMYHGWQFGPAGECKRIPTIDESERLPKKADVPARAAVERSGLVWVYAGDRLSADPDTIPSYPEYDSPDWWVAGQGVMDLDVDYSLVIENLVDASHVPFTHRGTLGSPDQGQPLDIDVQVQANGGYRAVVKATRTPVPIPDYFAFDPPCNVRIGRNDGSLVRLFHCIPLAMGRMRMTWWIAMHKPQLDDETRLLISDPEAARREEEEMAASQQMIYDEDIAMLKAQQSRINEGAPSFGCPVKNDIMSLRCREWRDENDGPGTWIGAQQLKEPKNAARKLPIAAPGGPDASGASGVSGVSDVGVAEAAKGAEPARA